MEQEQDQNQVITLSKERKPFKWSGVKIRACSLMAEGRLTYKKIAEQLEVSAPSIYKWSMYPEFQERQKQLYQQYEARVINQGIALKANRINALTKLHNRHNTIIRERAEKLAGRVMGGHSGLVVQEARSIGHGEDAQLVYDEVFDAALSREYRAVIAQVADEVGDSVTKHQITGANGGPLELTVGVMDEIANRVREAKKKVQALTPLANDRSEGADQGNAEDRGRGATINLLGSGDCDSGGN